MLNAHLQRGGDNISDGKDLTYDIKIDTQEAEESLDNLEEKGKSADERLRSLEERGSGIGRSISSGIGDGINSLDSIGSAADRAGNNVSNLSSASDAAGSRVTRSFQNMATESDGMAKSFSVNFSHATSEGKKFSDSLKTGVTGAVDTGKKKLSSFAKGISDGAKKIGKAVLHPVETFKDKFTKAMSKSAKDADSLGDAANDTKKDLSSMGDTGASVGDKIKSGLGKALGVLAAVAVAVTVVTGIAKFTKAAIDASQSADNIAYSFDKTFGDSAPDVLGWAENFSGAVHRSESQVKSFLSSNKQLYDSMGLTGEAGDQLAKVTTSLAYDFGNFFGIADDEALSKMQDAISGNETALAEYGVRLDDATLKQTALDMGLSGNIDTLDDATMAQVRMNAILEQTEGIQGAATESIGGFAGGVKALQGAWTSFMEKAGSKLAPVFEKIFGTILDMWPQIEPQLMTFVEILANGFETAIPIIGQLAEDLFPIFFDILGQLMPVIGTIAETILPVFASVLGTVASALQPVISFISKLVEAVLPPLTKIFETLISTLLPPLASLFDALSPILEGLSPIFEVIATVVGVVSSAIGTLIGWLGKAIEKIGEFANWVSEKLGGIGDFFGGIGDSIGNFFSGGGGATASNASGTDNFDGGWTNIHEAGDELVYAKHGGGVAYLPQGSAVIPASKTEQLLSDSEPSGLSQVVNVAKTLVTENSVPEIVNNIIDITPFLPKWKDEPEDSDDPHSDEENPSPKKNPPPLPNPTDGGGNNEYPSSPTPILVEIKIHLTSDGSVTPEMEEAVAKAVGPAVKEALAQINSDKTTFDTIQEGLTAG